MSERNFFAELKRRNVYKVAVAYLVVSWLVIQAASILLPTFDAPGWSMKLVVAVLVIGFPVSLVLAWAFEFTAEGIKLESEVAPNESITRRTGRKIVGITIALAVLAAGLFVFQQFRSKSLSQMEGVPPTPDSRGSAGARPSISAKSIAVLPFVNMTANKENEFFADGLSEEILNSLARIDGMQVVGRTSSFQFKGKTEDLRAIGEKLGAANVLEGSVRRDGERARITAQLVRASDGIHLWSETYDRTLTDTLAVQVDIAEQVAGVLNVVLDDQQRARMKAEGVKNVDAFIAYQKGLKLYADAHNKLKSSSVIDGLRVANNEFDRAIALEPGFSQPYFAAADLYDHILLADDQPQAEKLAAQQAALHYLELAAGNSHDEQQRLLTLADRQLVSDDWHGLAANLEAALKYPGCSAPDWVPVFAGVFGYGDLVEDLGARVSVCDPLNVINFNNRLRAALFSGKPQRALDVLAAADKARGGAPVPSLFRIQAFIMLGRVSDAQAQAAAMNPMEEYYYRAQVFAGAAAGESAATIHSRLKNVDRTHSLYKFEGLTDTIEVILMGDRAEANRRAAAYDAQPAGPFILSVLTADSLHGAPFDLDATPNFKARLAESGLRWPPPEVMKYPPRALEKQP
jgi:TolB-like protein